MSRTKRTEIRDPKNPVASRDKKKTYKPGKAAKAFLHKGKKAKLKQELKKTEDFDNLPAPREVKTDEWNYN